MRTFVLAAVGLFLLQPVGEAKAQDDALFDAILMDRLGFFESPRSGARSLALGGGGVAWTDDIQSLTLNPAGLTAIARIETQIGFGRQTHSQEVSYFGPAEEFAPTSTGLDALGIAYPLPTYRGSFVLAAGLFRPHDSVMESLWKGINAYDGDYESYSLQLDGAPMSMVVGAGLALSADTDVGLSLEYQRGELSMLSVFEFRSPAASDTLYRDIYDDMLDVQAWRAHLGLQSRLRENLQLGIRISSPTDMDIEGETVWEERVLDDGDLIDSEGDEGFFVWSQEIRLPYRVAAGALWRLGVAALSVEFEYVDWSQTRVDGRRLKNLDLAPALESTLNQHYGLQLESPRYPARIYLGYSRTPDPLRFLESGEFVDGLALLKENDVVDTRQGYSGGIGVFLSESLLLEAGYERQQSKRRTAPEADGSSDFVQSVERQRAVLTFSYRF